MLHLRKKLTGETLRADMPFDLEATIPSRDITTKWLLKKGSGPAIHVSLVKETSQIPIPSLMYGPTGRVVEIGGASGEVPIDGATARCRDPPWRRKWPVSPFGRSEAVISSEAPWWAPSSG
jgi:hypothetical protein